ncbi:hypothetical protein GGE56_004346 [Rhizobium leguminosarum]|nr:hypothetical protein [Rhizobium leguminosarum]MBB6296035.1 hypothetical protein [Rhizobium leguminosarum]
MDTESSPVFKGYELLTHQPLAKLTSSPFAIVP